MSVITTTRDFSTYGSTRAASESAVGACAVAATRSAAATTSAPLTAIVVERRERSWKSRFMERGLRFGMSGQLSGQRSSLYMIVVGSSAGVSDPRANRGITPTVT